VPPAVGHLARTGAQLRGPRHLAGWVSGLIMRSKSLQMLGRPQEMTSTPAIISFFTVCN
jgi:hypothetical protein